MAFKFVRNIAGFPANPGYYPLTNSVTFKEGDMVKLSSGKVVKAVAADTAILGVMAESITVPSSGTVYGLVMDNPLNVYRAPYTGTTPVVGATRSITDGSDTVDGTSSTGGQSVTILAVDTANSTCDVVITKHILN